MIKIKTKDKNGVLLKNHHHVYINQTVRRDCEIWKSFLQIARAEGSHLCRPFVDLEVFETSEQLFFYTDTSLNAKPGIGGVFGNRWIMQKWPEKFIKDQKPSIEFLELFALTAAVITWSRHITNTRIVIFCDNKAVVHMINNTTSKCRHCMKLICMLVLDGLISNRQVFVKHVLSNNFGNQHHLL